MQNLILDQEYPRIQNLIRTKNPQNKATSQTTDNYRYHYQRKINSKEGKLSEFTEREKSEQLDKVSARKPDLPDLAKVTLEDIGSEW